MDNPYLVKIAAIALPFVFVLIVLGIAKLSHSIEERIKDRDAGR